MCEECRTIAAVHAASIEPLAPLDQAGGDARIADLKGRYQILLARAAKLSNYVHLRRINTCEQHIQSEHDSISAEMTALAVQLSSMSSGSIDLLKLKASLLLDLMPDEDDVGVFLAVSMCDDILATADAAKAPAWP